MEKKSILTTTDSDVITDLKKIAHMRNMSVNGVVSKLLKKFVEENKQLVDAYDRIIGNGEI